MADGIHCGMCGAKIEPGAPAPTGAIPKQPKVVRPAADKAEPDPEPKKAAPKKGGKK
jgi:hypothetical protein